MADTVEDLGAIVIDLGKESRKKIKALKRGGGKLQREAAEATADLISRLGPEAVGKEFVPIVVVYTRKDDSKHMKLPSLF